MTTHLSDVRTEVLAEPAAPAVRPAGQPGQPGQTGLPSHPGQPGQPGQTGLPSHPGQPGQPGRSPDAVQEESRRLVMEHLRAVTPALESLAQNAGTLAGWGVEMATRLMAGQRLLAAGNGGSAAEAQHLTAELVGRFDGEREPFSAISLHAESSAVTAIANDYGFDRMFARQVGAHGRSGDILVLLSTSGKSPNLLQAVDTARAVGLTTWALTGAGPNPLTECVDDFVAIDATSANAQEGHLIALHAMCRAFDAEVHRRRREEQR